MTPGERLAESLRSGHRRWLESTRRAPQVQHSNRASEMGHPCLRYLTLLRHHPKPRTSDGLQGTFEEGKLHEEHVKKVLSWMGYQPYGSEASFPPNAYGLTGHIDCQLGVLKDNEVVRVGLEIKSLTAPNWDPIREDDGGESIKNHRAAYVRRWFTQDQTYAFLNDVEEWTFLCKNKITGAWKIVVTPIDYAHVQECLDRAAAVNAHVEANTLPGYIQDPIICRWCPYFGGVCQPGLDYGPGAIVVADEEWAERWERALDDRETRLRTTEEYERVKEWAKTVSGGQDRYIICGNALVHVRFSNGRMLPLRVERL